VLHRAHRAHRLHASLLTYTELSMKYCLLIRRSICIKHRPKPSTMLPSKNRSIDTTHLKVLRSQYHIYIYIYIWRKKKKKKKLGTIFEWRHVTPKRNCPYCLSIDAWCHEKIILKYTDPPNQKRGWAWRGKNRATHWPASWLCGEWLKFCT
jgi:hypothetical protein